MRKKGISAGGIALTIILVVLAVVGVFVGVYWDNIKKIFDDVDEKYFEEESYTDINKGFNVNDSFNSGVFVQSVALAESDYEEYGVMPTAESAYSVSATYNASYVSFPSVDWTVSFVNDASEWATGKTVTDYVTVSPISDGALEAVVTCLQPFGEQIQVSVTNRANTGVSASILCDYAKPITSESVYLFTEDFVDRVGPKTVMLSDNWFEPTFLNSTLSKERVLPRVLQISPNGYGVGTIAGTGNVEEVSICYTGIEWEKLSIPELTLKDGVTSGVDYENGFAYAKMTIDGEYAFNLTLPLVDFFEEADDILTGWQYVNGVIDELPDGVDLDLYYAYASVMAENWDFDNCKYFVSLKLSGCVEKEYLNVALSISEEWFIVKPTSINTDVSNITFGQ